MTATYSMCQTPSIPPRTSCDVGGTADVDHQALAHVRVTMKNRSVVYFCGNHFKENQAALEAQALFIEDERHLAHYLSEEKPVGAL